MTAQSVIKNFMTYLDNTSLNGTAALDAAVASVSKFKSWAELISTMANDCAAYLSHGEDFLKDKCGIILNNADTGAISGSDAGGTDIKTAESIVPESGIWTYPSSDTFNVNGLTVKINNFDNLSQSERWIVGALYTWWIKESLTLINSSYGFSFNEPGTTIKTLNVYFYNSTDGNMAISNYSTGQKSTELRLNINMYYYSNINMTDPNGIGSSAALNTLDRTIVHELVHAVMSANVDWYNNLPVSFKEGAAELIHGIDDKRYNQLVALANNSTFLSNSMSGTDVNAYAAGYIALRYLAKQASEGRDPSDYIVSPYSLHGVTHIALLRLEEQAAAEGRDPYSSIFSTLPSATSETLPSSNMTFDGVTMKISGTPNENIFLSTINPFTGEISTYGNEAAIVLDASETSGSFFIGGNSNNNYIIGGTNSTIWGGPGGSDTLQSGEGSTNFWYLPGSGNDTIIRFSTGIYGDVLSFIGWGLTGFYRENNFVTAFVNDGGSFTTILDSGTVDDPIKLSADGENTIYANIGYTNATNDFIYRGDDIVYWGGNNIDAVHVMSPNVVVDLSNGPYVSVEVIDGTSSGGNCVLFGDANNNYIFSGGNNSALWGGAGDDVIYGGTGTDFFLFGAGEGNDIIFNVEDNDYINFYNATLSDLTFAQETDSGMIFGVGFNVLTVVGQSNTAISFADGNSLRYNRNAKVWTNA